MRTIMEWDSAQQLHVIRDAETHDKIASFGDIGRCYVLYWAKPWSYQHIPKGAGYDKTLAEIRRSIARSGQ